jgi:acetyl-CoA C-acetyltransferase
MTIEDVITSRLVADPLRLFDCCPISDGAACVLLTSADKARKYTDTPIIIEACAQTSGTLALFDRKDICTIDATVEASKEAFQHANLKHKDIDVIEAHDCFTIAEIFALEDLGFCAKGEAGKMYDEVTLLEQQELSKLLS